eukprot:Rmarinus@m.21253
MTLFSILLYNVCLEGARGSSLFSPTLWSSDVFSVDLVNVAPVCSTSFHRYKLGVSGSLQRVLWIPMLFGFEGNPSDVSAPALLAMPVASTPQASAFMLPLVLLRQFLWLIHITTKVSGS